MFAVAATGVDKTNPLNAMSIGTWPDPEPADGWTVVELAAAGLNHHDLWLLRGVGARVDRLPLILGGEGAGMDKDGRPVIIYPLVGDPLAGRGDATLDPRMGMLSTDYHGTFAQRVAIPRANLLPKPPELTFEEAACLPGAWLTAYRMLFEHSGLTPGQTALVQGAGGGVSTALIRMGAATGMRIWATSGSAKKRRLALQLGAERVFPHGARLPERVDVVMESVGAATWQHSINCLRNGGRIVVCGATTGACPPLDLAQVFYRQLSVIGSTLGTQSQLADLIQFCVRTGIRPTFDQVLPLQEAREGFAAMAEGRLFGKVVFQVAPLADRTAAVGHPANGKINSVA
jgi:NADPH:quinone reductase-like Zn-dependent oxidoreductase